MGQSSQMPVSEITKLVQIPPGQKDKLKSNETELRPHFPPFVCLCWQQKTRTTGTVLTIIKHRCSNPCKGIAAYLVEIQCAELDKEQKNMETMFTSHMVRTTEWRFQHAFKEFLVFHLKSSPMLTMYGSIIWNQLLWHIMKYKMKFCW